MGWMVHATRTGSALEHVPSSHTIQDSIAANAVAEPVDHSDAGPAGTKHLAAWQPIEKDSLPTLKDVIRAVGRVRLGTQTEGTDVPILAGPGMNEQWLRDQPPPLTAYGQVALQRHGYHVDQSRRLVTTTMADGRRVTVPVDEVQIRYTGK